MVKTGERRMKTNIEIRKNWVMNECDLCGELMGYIIQNVFMRDMTQVKVRHTTICPKCYDKTVGD